jgi:hypothetical protein
MSKATFFFLGVVVGALLMAGGFTSGFLVRYLPVGSPAPAPTIVATMPVVATIPVEAPVPGVGPGLSSADLTVVALPHPPPNALYLFSMTPLLQMGGGTRCQGYVANYAASWTVTHLRVLLQVIGPGEAVLSQAEAALASTTLGPGDKADWSYAFPEGYDVTNTRVVRTIARWHWQTPSGEEDPEESLKRA